MYISHDHEYYLNEHVGCITLFTLSGYTEKSVALVVDMFGAVNLYTVCVRYVIIML